MSAHGYNEDQLVEQPAVGLFAELGWTTVSAMEETFGATGTLLRETKGEVALASPDTTRKILQCLGLPARPPPIAVARPDPQESLPFDSDEAAPLD